MNESATTREATITTRNISGVLLLRLVQFPFLALYVMLVPRIMGPEIYGELAFLISIITIAASLVNIGIGDIFGRFIPEHEAKNEWQGINSLFTNMLALKTIISATVSIVLYLMLNLAYGDRFSPVYFMLVVITVMIIDWESAFYSLLFGLNKLVKFSLREPIRRMLSLALVLILFHYYGLLGAIGSTFLVETSMLVLGFFLTRNYFHFKDFRVNLSILIPYLKFGFILYVSGFLLIFWQRFGNILIDILIGKPEEIAFFDIANNIFLVFMSITIIAINSLVPMFTKFLITAKEYKMVIWSDRIIKYMIILNVIFFSSLVFVGSDIIPLLIGSDYAEVFPNVVVLLFGLFPMSLAQMGFVYSVVYKKPQRYFLALCLAIVTFLIFSLILIPKYLSLGCSIASCASCFSFAVVLIYIFRDKLLACLKDGLIAAALGCFIVPLSFFRGELITNFVLLFIFILAYFLALFATRRLSVNEIKEIYFSLMGNT